MSKQYGVALLLVLGSLFLAACGGGAGGADLDGTSWRLVSMNGSSPLVGTTTTIAFSGGEVSGSACNTYFGSYTVRGGDLTIGTLAATEMACLEPEGIMQQESQYLSILATAASYEIVGSQLEITSAGGEVLVYARQ